MKSLTRALLSLLPKQGEKKQDRSPREKLFRNKIDQLINESYANNQSMSQVYPTDWADSLEEEFFPFLINEELQATITKICTAIQNPNDIIDIANKFNHLALATISTGEKGQIKILHHIRHESNSIFAIDGLNHNFSPVEITKPQKIFETKFTPKIPDLKGIMTFHTSEDPSELMIDDFKLDEFPSSNTIFLPPALTKRLTENGSTHITPSEALKTTIEFALSLDADNGIESLIKVDPAPFDQDNNDEEKSSVLEENWNEINNASALWIFNHTIRTLFRWAQNKSAITAAFEESNKEQALTWIEEIKHSIMPTVQHSQTETSQEDDNNPAPTNNISIPSPPSPGSRPQNNRPRLRSPSKEHPRVTLTSDNNHANANLNEVFNQETTPQPSIPTQHPPISSAEQFALFQQFINWKNLQTQPATTNSTHITSVLTNLIDSTARSNQLNERMVEAHEATLKLKENNAKNKVSAPTDAFLKNFFTTDGVKPLEETPKELKDLMTTSADITSANIDLLLHKNKTPAKLTTSLVKAINKGNYGGDQSKPTGFSPFSVAFSLNGSNQENFDTQQLLEAEERGDDLSEDQKTALKEGTIIIPRTVGFLLKSIKAFVTILSIGGEESIIHLTVKDLASFIEENELLLSENTANSDKQLPTRIAYTIHSAIQNYVHESKYMVSGTKFLNFEHVKRGAVSNIPFVTLPPFINKFLESKNKKKDHEKPNNGEKQRDNKRTLVTVTHEDQPIQLKTSRDTYNDTINQALKNIRSHPNLEIPKHNGEQECLRFAYLGECLNNCNRSKNHKSVKADSARFKKLLEFKKKTTELKNDQGNKDFQ